MKKLLAYIFKDWEHFLIRYYTSECILHDQIIQRKI